MQDFIVNTCKFIWSFFWSFILVLIFLCICLFGIYSIAHTQFGLSLNDICKNFTLIKITPIILTMALIVVAGLQLNKINKTSIADFLLRIDSRYGSQDIIAARAIIQRLYRKANPDKKRVCEAIYIEKISDSIDRIRTSKDEASCKDFSYLLNLLDFLETISYFSRKKYISVNDVDDLIGNSMIFYYKIYKRWIYYRRNTYKNPTYYCEFENLVRKLESLQVKNELARTCFIIKVINYFH